MMPKTIWITLRVLGLLLACLSVTIWKLSSVFGQQRAHSVVLISSPDADLAVGPQSLGIESIDPEPRSDLTDLTIDLALAWSHLHPEVRLAWLKWLLKTSEATPYDYFRLEFFRDIAGSRLTQAEVKALGKAIQRQSNAIEADDRNLPGEFFVCGLGLYHQPELNQFSLKTMLLSSLGTLLVLIIIHHFTNYRALKRVHHRLGFGPNPPLNSDPTCTAC
jgi:hypothetical protein